VARHDAGSNRWLAIRYQPGLVSQNEPKIEPNAITPTSAMIALTMVIQAPDELRRSDVSRVSSLAW